MKKTQYVILHTAIGLPVTFDTPQEANKFLERVDAGGKRIKDIALIRSTVETFSEFFPTAQHSPATGHAAADFINQLKTKGEKQ